MKRIVNVMLLLIASGCMAACGDMSEHEDVLAMWPWTDPEPTPDPEQGDDDEPVVTVDAKPRVIWIDAAANFPRYANSRENIAEDLEKIKNTGFTEIVVDVRPSMGDVLFKTDKTEQVKKLDCWINGMYQFYERTADWDYLQAFIDEGHSLGLKVLAGFNTLTGGCLYPYGLTEQGMVFRDADKRDWVETLYTSKGPVNAMDLTSTDPSSSDYCDTKFLNPSNPDVQDFVLSLIDDLCQYDIDGIVLDRCRYDNIMADVSSITKEAFYDYMGTTDVKFPSEVLLPGGATVSGHEPKYYKDFLAFRAKTICDFVERIVNRAHGVKSDLKVGVYVGAWYSEYYKMGVNWASCDYDPSAEFSWANSDYQQYGFAQKLDFMLLGCYASASSVYGSSEWTMQGFCTEAQKKILGATKFYGGPDVGNPSGFENGDAYEAVQNSVDACINASDGYFLFDVCHVRAYDYWTYIFKGINAYLKSLE